MRSTDRVLQMTNDFGLNWTAPKEVNTKFGPRVLRKGSGDLAAFWDAWRADKAGLKAEGFSVSKTTSGGWEVAHWGKVGQAEIAQREAAVEASRATDVVDLDVPAPAGLSYLPFQRAGIAYGLSRPAVLFGDEMGLGKTIQAIGILNASPEAKRVLIICPASLKLNWARELNKWLVRKNCITIVNGAEIVPDSVKHPDGGILIVNYDILHKHIDFLRSVTWDVLIADEAHYCKNRNARRTQMLFGARASRKTAAVPAI